MCVNRSIRHSKPPAQGVGPERRRTTCRAGGLRKAPERGQRITTKSVPRRQPVLALVIMLVLVLVLVIALVIAIEDGHHWGYPNFDGNESSTSTAMLSTSTSTNLAGTVEPNEFSPAELVVYDIELVSVLPNITRSHQGRVLGRSACFFKAPGR